MPFTRKSDYKQAIADVQAFCESYGEGILPIPNEESIICYYQGKPIVGINDQNWSFWGPDYNKYFDPERGLLEAKKNCRTKQQRQAVYGAPHIDEIRDAIGKGLPSDKERFSEQDIAQRALCDFGKNGYVLCGMETAISSELLHNYTGNDQNRLKPEIDIVAINPTDKKILLIEYKCQKRTLLTNKKNIVAHAKDYLKVKTWIQEDPNHEFVQGMLNSYKVMCSIYGHRFDDTLNAKDFPKESVEIVFLLTNRPSEGRLPSTNPQNNLAKNDYQSAVNLLRADETLKADDAYYIAYACPEDITEIPADIISDKYKGTKKLVWKQEW